jgi:6-phosphofructokinase
MLNGNAIVGQSGGPTTAINATLSGVIKGAYQCEFIDKIYGMFNGINGLLDESLCLINNILENESDFNILENTPAAALGSCRKKLPEFEKDNDIYVKIFNILEKYNIKYFFYIGGNDSMDTVVKLSEYAKNNNYEIYIIGVPKTIDNDLPVIDHTPGYGSAAKYIAASMQEIIRDCNVYFVKSVTIVEIMGRDAGWLTAAAALPRIICDVSPDLVYLPEKPFDTVQFLTDVNDALTRNPNVVVAVSEGVRDSEGNYLGAAGYKGVDVFGHVNLSGAGKYLEMLLHDKIGCKVRSVELNVLQRCAAHIASKTDIDESVRIGMAAVEAACNGLTGVMMIYKRVSDEPYTIEIDKVDIKLIANLVKRVPDEFITADNNNVTDECLNYIKPLINGEVNPPYKDGLPVHITLK